MADSSILKPFILSFEGGYSNKKSDRGGATMKGVTLETFRKVYGASKTASDLKKITDEQWHHIFKKYYWDACKADQINNQSVANLLVDFAYNSGVSRAVQKIQTIVGTKADGIMGNMTLAAINSYKQGQWSLFDKLKVSRIAFLNAFVNNEPKQSVNLHGWLRRVGTLLKATGILCVLVILVLDRKFLPLVGIGKAMSWITWIGTHLIIIGIRSLNRSSRRQVKSMWDRH